MAAAGNKSINAKLVLLGDVGARKSSLVLRFVKDQFVEFQESTIGAAFFSQTLVVNDATVKFEIWDTAGQERYHSLAPMYYRFAKMSVVGFDVGNENCVIAVAKQRGIDVLLNDESNRENPAMVSFSEKQRFMGAAVAAAAASATMHPKSTISQLKRLIGRKFREPDVQNDLRF